MRFRNHLHFLLWKACQCCFWVAGEAACAFGKSFEVEQDLSTPTGFEIALRLAWGGVQARECLVGAGLLVMGVGWPKQHRPQWCLPSWRRKPTCCSPGKPDGRQCLRHLARRTAA